MANPDLQKIFDRGVKAIIEQGKPSYNTSHDLCMYRGPENTMCLFGHLIDDEHYDISLEELTADHRDVIEAVRKSNPDLKGMPTPSVLKELQECHDQPALNVQFVPEFIQNARRFAEKYALDTTVLDEMEY